MNLKEKDGDEGVNQLQGAEVQGAADNGGFLPSFIQQMSVSCSVDECVCVLGRGGGGHEGHSVEGLSS